MKTSERLWDPENNPDELFFGDIPMIHSYTPEVQKGDGAVIIFTGGGYRMRAPHEAEPYALKLNEMGLVAFVVDYRVSPSNCEWPVADAIKAMRTVRNKSHIYKINPNKIAVMGSSAGGHLAATCGNFNPFHMPNAQILCYPVTDIESHRGSYECLLGDDIDKADLWSPITQAGKHTPPTFIWHTSSDAGVDVKGTYRYAARLSELGVPVEMHIYPVGGHGLGLANGLYGRATEPYVQRWIEDLERWLKLIGWITE